MFIRKETHDKSNNENIVKLASISVTGPIIKKSCDTLVCISYVAIMEDITLVKWENVCLLDHGPPKW